jgi:hypothetical protein
MNPTIILVLMAMLISAAQAVAQTNQQKTNTVTELPLVGDETSVSALIASPRKYQDKPVVISGCITVGNYYNYRYEQASKSHFSLRFVELTKDLKFNEELTIYAERGMAGPLVNKVLKTQREGDCHGVRLKVVITSRSFEYGDFNENAELVDWQFYDTEKREWEDWAKHPKPPPPRVATPAEIAAAKERAEKKRQESQAAALKWNRELAEKGDAYGQLRMGERYLTGDGVEKDETKAREYFTKAAAQGNKDAAAALEKTRLKP